MKKSKTTPSNGVSSNFTPPPKLMPPKNSELYVIQQRLNKASLYLNLLEYEFVQSPDVQLAVEVNNEIKSFITSTVKKLLGIEISSVNTAFSTPEEKALKFIAQKFINTEAKPIKVHTQPVLAVESDDVDEPEEEIEDPVVPKRKTQSSNVIKTKVMVTKSDGSVSEEESVTQRIVKPAPAAKRIPPPSYEQQLAAAAAAVAPLRQHLNTFNAMPMMAAVDSSED